MPRVYNTKKKIKEQEEEDAIQQTCDMCYFAIWVTDNPTHIDFEGKPICIRCKHYPYMRLRGTKACNKFKSVGKG